MNSPEYTLTDLTTAINVLVRPPKPVGSKDIQIRSMLIASDRINDHGGRFPEEELTRLTKLLIDTPVLIGHDRCRLPIARTFQAGLVRRDDINWVKVWFYWPIASDHDTRLRSLLDSGIAKEGSLGFEYQWPECSVCGADFRRCEHELSRGNEAERVWYNYRGIVRVLETSLVYRGAVPGTQIELATKTSDVDSRTQRQDSDRSAPGRTTKSEIEDPPNTTIPFAEFRVSGPISRKSAPLRS